MRRVTRDIVAALIFSKDGKLLLGLADPEAGGAYAGLWCIPGGGIEDGETEIEAVVREVREETSLDVSALQLKLVNSGNGDVREKRLKETGETVLVDMKFHDYEVRLDMDADEAGPLASDEFVAFKWIALKDLSNVRLPQPTKALLKKLGCM